MTYLVAATHQINLQTSRSIIYISKINMGVLHSFSIKNIFYDKMELRLYFYVVKYLWWSNFIPDRLVTFNDKDPPWRNDFIRNKIKWKIRPTIHLSKMVAPLMIINDFSVLKTLYYGRKIPIWLVSDFKAKPNLFNNFLT